ncbi:MAG: HEAT repeat domain-containing protein [Candidatus Riflebacteria bacterium]|nr:HEAT repeat domain-containing protein [Candidatus Riflebacteria bacterium]
MSQENTLPPRWHQIIDESLTSENVEERTFALDFLSQQSSLTLELATELMPRIVEAIVHPDTRVRYFARRARNQILDSFPEIDSGRSQEPFKLDLKEGQQLTAREILLHKMRLGSRYVVFEAMDRLTESGDAALTEPLLDFLGKEKDEYKVSYLLRLLGRIDHPRIPETLEKYLEHEDSRIVANAIEALCEFDRPDLAERFAELATSSDNRVRANAVLGLHRYSPTLAEQHISEMIHSGNIALQDSGVFLLRTIRPANLGELLEIAHHSRYATVRLKALDIPPPTSEETKVATMALQEDYERPDHRRDLTLLVCFLITAIAILFVADESNKRLLSVLFLGLALVTMLMPDKARTSIQKTSISMGFISSMAWGNTRLMILPGLMGLWLTWNAGQTNQRGKPEKARPAHIVAWFFSVGAIIITQLVQGNFPEIFGLAGQISALSARVDSSILDIVERQKSFEITIFTFIAAMTIAIMTFDSWFPGSRDEDPDKPSRSPRKRLILATILCLAIILLLNVFHTIGIALQLKLSGMSNSLSVLKQLIP